MDPFPEMYFYLFNQISDAVRLLQKAQREAEELYASITDPDDSSP